MKAIAGSCKNCGQDLNTGWDFCPYCGCSLDYKNFPFVKLNYLWERDRRGLFLHDNFRLVREVGLRPYKKLPCVRERLGDSSNILLLGLRRFSILSLNPSFNQHLYTASKLLGYFSGEVFLKTTHLDSLVGRLKKTGIFWKVFENKQVMEGYSLGWKALDSALVKIEGIDRENKTLTMKINEGANYPFKSEKQICSIELGAISGHLEVFFDGFGSGEEIKCHCVDGEHDLFKMRFSDEEVDSLLPTISSDEFSKILAQAVDFVVKRRTGLRPTLADTMFIGPDQLFNYLLICPSPGHAVLSKHSGVLCGRQIAEHAGVSGKDSAFDYVKELFLYLKAGILHSPEPRGDHLFLKMDESVYASGVSNINMKLCVFLAGIIEGVLCQATGERWEVRETRCIASGSDNCMFTCKKMR